MWNISCTFSTLFRPSVITWNNKINRSLIQTNNSFFASFYRFSQMFYEVSVGILLLFLYKHIKNINFTMLEIINFSEIFTILLNKYYEKYKNNNGFIKKHLLQTRYLSLLSFIYNSCYWSRFNKDPDTGKWLSNCISGKYLNEIHLFLVKHNFYRTLY